MTRVLEIVCLTVMLAIFAACTATQQPAPAPPAAEPEPETLSATFWSARTELFIEHPPLVQGQSAACAVHLTDLSTFRPLAEGQAILELEKDGKIARFESTAPKYPGIFRVDATPESSGRYRGRLLVRTPKLQDMHDLGEVVVYENQAAATHAAKAAPEPAEAIRFLKEQQWGSEFATEAAALRRIVENIRVPAVVKQRGGGDGVAVSPVRGRLLPEPKLPIPGQHVRQGEVVAVVVPFIDNPQDLAGLKLDLSQAETDLTQAQRQRERLAGLLAERAIPAYRVREAEIEELRVKARLDAAKARMAQFERTRSGAATAEDAPSSFQVRAPLEGTVTELSVVNGGAVESGKEILHIVTMDRVWVEAQVPESESGLLRRLNGAELEIPGNPEFIRIPGNRGKIERIGRILDPDSRRVPVIIEVNNQDGLLRIGQSLFVRLGIGETAERVSVPAAAIVDDGGRSIVLVQIAGEAFQRRPVHTGSTAGGYVQILDGLKPGERVVTQGAYSVRLAALSTQIPAHGHVH